MSKEKINELGRIIDRYQDELFRFAFFRTGSYDDSRDIVQNVFFKMYDGKEKLSTIDNIKSYLYRSISNRCSNYTRRKQSIRTVSLDKVTLTSDTPENDELHMEYERLRKKMDELPREQAEVIMMNTVDGLSFVEIAEILEIPVTTAKSRCKYGIDKLRSKIKNREEIL